MILVLCTSRFETFWRLFSVLFGNTGAVTFNPNSSRFVCMMASCSSSRPAKKAEGENPTGPNWLDLPTEVTANILHRLDTVDIVTSACLVCPLWWNICKDPFMWRTIDIGSPYIDYIGFGYLHNICRYAVDRSCGHLEDITIEEFASDNLLEYIADRASNLRRIRLAKCVALSDKVLRKVMKKLPLLEEVDITFMLTPLSLKVIGRCCPFLKSLKFSRVFSKGYKSNAEAFAIAKSMPKLQHLKIAGHVLTNVGLLAILDKCPLLKSLDLRFCFHLDLSGRLGKRCRKQIKNLRLPDDYHVDDETDYTYDSSKDDFYSDSPSESSEEW